MRICQYNPGGVGELASFNLDASLLQRRAGVSPEECMQIVECDETVYPIGDTPIDIYLAHIAGRKYATPPVGSSQVRGYDARGHDEVMHFGTVVAVHPKIVGVYALIAATGIEDEGRGTINKIFTADMLDGALGTSISHIFNRIAGNPPQGGTLSWGPLTFTPDDRQALLDIESSHSKKIWGSVCNDSFGD